MSGEWIYFDRFGWYIIQTAPGSSEWKKIAGIKHPCAWRFPVKYSQSNVLCSLSFLYSTERLPDGYVKWIIQHVFLNF